MLAVKSMYMEEQPVVKPHRLTMQNRSTIQVTGVSDVIAYDPGEIILRTTFALDRGCLGNRRRIRPADRGERSFDRRGRRHALDRLPR